MNVAIVGYGAEGRANYQYWSRDTHNTITIVDERPELPDAPVGVKTILGPTALQQLEGFDLVVRTAGLAPYKLTTNSRVWSATNEFFAQCPAPIIGVTGSKGKGTTASLIASILEAAGKKVWLVGNIGLPSIEVLANIAPEDIVVYELSSFQLWDIQSSPHIAVVLHIERDHMDVHRSMDEYVEAKAQITRFQTEADTLIFNADNNYSRRIADSSVAQKVGYPSELEAHVREGYFYYGEQQLCEASVLQIKGDHNISNALAAIDAVWEYTQDPGAMAAGLHAFKGLPHRLAYVATAHGVEYYDDSIATTPGSAIAALRAFPDKQKVIILGGSSKGSDFSELATELTQHNAYALLIGDEAPVIAAALEAAGFSSFEILEAPTAESFTRRAAELAAPGSVVLLSPASASFGLFKNYADRGEQFIAAVKSLA